MNKNIEETVRVHNNDLDFLMKTTDVIEHFFMIEGIEIDAHVSNITKRKYSSKNHLGQKYRRCIELAELENTLLNIFPDLWEELGEAVRTEI